MCLGALSQSRFAYRSLPVTPRPSYYPVAPTRCSKVDIGDLDARVVNEAISKAGGDRAGIMSVTKGVQAAAACM